MLLSNLIFPLLILFSTLQIINAFTQSGYNIKDLTSTDAGGLGSEAGAWVLGSGACSACIYTLPGDACTASDVVAYGGPAANPAPSDMFQMTSFSRTYTGLGSTWTNFAMEFDVFVWKSASVTLDMTAFLWVWFGTDINNMITPGGFIQTCNSGTTYKYRAQYLFHNTGDLAVGVWFVFPVGVTAVAFRNINIFPMPSTANSGYTNFPCNAPSEWDGSACSTCFAGCQSCSSPGNGNCIGGCKSGYFDYQNGYCQTTCDGPFAPVGGTNVCAKRCSTGFYWERDQSCRATCSAPLVSGTDSNGFAICNSPCVVGDFVYPDGSCAGNCDAPLTTDIAATLKLCLNPCLGGGAGVSPKFLYPDGSCSDTCQDNLSQKTMQNIKYCFSYCAISQFIYPDGSCDANCPGPLANKIQYTLKFCYSPCDANDPSLFLYPEGTCKNTCPDPLSNKIERKIKYCYSNCGSQWIYPDASCSLTCPAPLKQQTEYTIPFCVSPCDPNDPSLFLYPEGTCKNTCPDPLSNKIERKILYCYSNCGSQWLYPDASCSSTCDFPLKEEIQYTIPFCISPCDPNDPSLFLYPNSSCVNSCPAPLKDKVERKVLYCYSPCKPDFIYPDGTCSSTCDAPLVEQIDYTIPFCTSPCDYSTGSTVYLYPNSSCYGTCASPLYNKTEYTILQCYSPCLENSTFLYQNRSCHETCPYPNHPREEPISKFCNFPCQNWDNYWNTGSEKCKVTCEYPGEPVESPLPKLCISTLNDEEVKQIKEMAGMANSANSASGTGTMIWNVVSSSDSTAACMGPLAKMLQYIKYMDIEFPEMVLLMMDEQNKDALKGGFSKKMMERVLDEFPRHELPSKFELYQTPSSFFVNFWAAMFNLSVILFVTLTVVLLTMTTKGCQKVNGILRGVVDILKWNLALVTFSGNLGDLVLFSSLEFQSMQFDNLAAVLSFIFCLLVNTVAIFVVVKILDVNSAIRKSRERITGNGARAELQKKRIVQKWSSYKALFDCYKDYSFYQQIFLFVFIVRMTLFNALIGYFYKYPMFQAITFSLFNILMLGYLVIKRPMKKIVNLVQQIVLELVLLPFNTCVLALAIMDNQDIEKQDLRKTIGTIIIYINVAVPILSLVLMFVKFVAIAIELYQAWKIAKAKKAKRLKAIQISRPSGGEIIEEQQRFGALTPSDITSFPSRTLSDSIQMLDSHEQSILNTDLVIGGNQQKRIKPPRSQNLLAPYNYTNQNLHTLETTNLDLSSDQANYPPTQLQLSILQGQFRDRQSNHVAKTFLSQINERRMRRRNGKQSQKSSDSGLNSRSRSRR